MATLTNTHRVVRSLPPGEYPLIQLLPGLLESPALMKIEAEALDRNRLVLEARVLICGQDGFAFVDVENRRIVLSEQYYVAGRELDLYLDLLHELTHLRQLGQGFDLWDERFEYVDRPTEVEAYAVAIAEARRLGFSELEIREYLTVPWLTHEEVNQLLVHVNSFLAGGCLPNVVQALFGAPFVAQQPWRCAKPVDAALQDDSPRDTPQKGQLPSSVG